jgi:hypothetical protein
MSRRCCCIFAQGQFYPDFTLSSGNSNGAKVSGFDFSLQNRFLESVGFAAARFADESEGFDLYGLLD